MSPANAPPHLAATVLVIRECGSGAAPANDIEVLLVRRSHRASFMANAYVFPGGRVDAADAAASPSPGASAAASPDPLLAMRRAAARELGEEVGLQVGELAQLVPFAHWITPSAEPKRFDTAFFLWPLGLPESGASGLAASAAPPDVQVDGSEVFDPVWITPAAALTRYAEGTLNLPPPTVCTLEDLAADVAAARATGVANRAFPGPRTAHGPAALLQTLLTRCAARRPLPVLPKFCAESDGALSIVMPWDAHYAELPGDGNPVPALAENAAPVACRIRRCQLRPVGVGSAAGVGAKDLSVVPWTVERAL